MDKDIFGKTIKREETPQTNVSQETPTQYAEKAFGEGFVKKSLTFGSLLSEQKNKTEIWETEDRYETLPEGEYVSQVKSIKVKETKDGDEMVSIEHEIMEGEYKGRFANQAIFFRSMFDETEEQVKKTFGRAFSIFAHTIKLAFGLEQENALAMASTLLETFVENREDVFLDSSKLPKVRKNLKLTGDGRRYKVSKI